MPQSASLASPFRNILRLATGDFVAKGLSFLAFVYLARVLGVSNFGTLEFAGSVLTYLLLIADGGLEKWGTREAARTTDMRTLAAKLLPFRLLLASISFALLVLLLPLFPEYPKLRVVMVLYGLSVYAQALNLKWTFMGQENMGRVARGLVAGQIIIALAVFAFIHNASGLIWIPLLRLVGDLVTAAYFGRWFVRTHGSHPFKLTTQGSQVALKAAFMLGLSQAMGLLNYNFDAVLLGFLKGATFVGWYNAAYKIILVGVTFPITYVTGLFPALARSYADNREEFRQLMRRSGELWLAFVVPLTLGGTFLAKPIISFLYGNDYTNSARPLQILAWSAALVSLRVVYSNALRATGYQALDVRCAFTSASLNVGLNILLIPRYGMVGAASATVSADVIWFAMSFYYCRLTILADEPLPPIRGPLIGGLAMGAILWFAHSLVWEVRAILGLTVYLVALTAFGSLPLKVFFQKPPES